VGRGFISTSIIAVASLLFAAGAVFPNQLDDRAQIEKLVQTEVAGMIARDVDKIMSLYVHSDEMMEFDASPPLEYAGWDALRALYMRSG
jgi:hypothetical protein